MFKKKKQNKKTGLFNLHRRKVIFTNNILRKMLTGAPGTLVKDMKKEII